MFRQKTYFTVGLFAFIHSEVTLPTAHTLGRLSLLSLQCVKHAVCTIGSHFSFGYLQPLRRVESLLVVSVKEITKNFLHTNFF